MNYASCLLIIILNILILMLSGCSSVDSSPAIPLQNFRISQHSSFTNYNAVLQRLTIDEKKNTQQNHFCILGYRSSENRHFAWVYWQEEKAFILWEPYIPEMQSETDLRRSRRYLKMPDDFVKTEDEIAGSTYLVTYAWGEKLVRDCQKKGAQYTISPFR